MCLARCSYEGGPETGRGRLARDRRHRGQWRRKKEKRERVKGKGTLALEAGSRYIHVAAHGHFQAISPSERQALALDRHRDCSRSDTAIGASYSYKFEYPTHPRPDYTRSNLYKKSRLKAEYAGSEPRGVWLCTLPSGSGYRHKHTHTTVLPACHFALYLATLVC